MRTLFMTLLVSLTILLTVNYFTYAEDVDINDKTITYNVRNTSDGLLVELSEDDYRFILTTALTEHERAILWKDKYENLLDETVWKETYDKVFSTMEKQDEVIQQQNKKISFYKTISISLTLALSSMLVYHIVR